MEVVGDAAHGRGLVSGFSRVGERGFRGSVGLSDEGHGETVRMQEAQQEEAEEEKRLRGKGVRSYRPFLLSERENSATGEQWLKSGNTSRGLVCIYVILSHKQQSVNRWSLADAVGHLGLI